MACTPLPLGPEAAAAASGRRPGQRGDRNASSAFRHKEFHHGPCSAEPPLLFTMFSVFSRYLPRVLAAITSGFVSNQAAVWAAPTGSNLAVLLQTAGSQMACIWVPFCALCVKQRLDLSDEKTVHQIRENLGTPNKPLEWTGHHQLSTGPAQIHCLPLRGSVRRIGLVRLCSAMAKRASTPICKHCFFC